jgi:hypothetical protein
MKEERMVKERKEQVEEDGIRMQVVELEQQLGSQ